MAKQADSGSLKRALERIRNPAPGVSLASHGWSKRCEVCERQTHAKWHEAARGDINPIALIQFVEAQRAHAPGVTDAIVGYVMAVTGMDVSKMRAMLESERKVDAVDPQGGDSNA